MREEDQENLTDYVDPFIGTDGAGNCLCGPYLPLSLVRLGPDTLGDQPTSGYRSDRPIGRFSHTHVSGTGGGGRYGNIGVTPFTGLPRLSIDGYERENEVAAPGYYAVTLLPSRINVELTVTPRVGLHRYTFPVDTAANILVDAGSVIQVWETEVAVSIGGFVEWISETELIGRADLQGGWGHSFPYSVYFYAHFDVPAQQRLVARHTDVVKGSVASGSHCRAVASFGKVGLVSVCVGISYVSIANARSSVAREVGAKDFEEVRTEAVTTWENALERIRVTGGTQEQRTLFYTLFTRLLCMPSDLGIDDENPRWASGVRHFTDYYCLWDSVRNANSLISLFDPDLETALLNGLLDIADHTGWLPDSWIAGHCGKRQGSSTSAILFCEARLKGLRGIDYEKALTFMRKDNEVESPDPTIYGRYLYDYRSLGYVSTNIRKNCVSRHLEYTYQDWCIGELAERLGQHDTAQMYYASARNVWKLWREDIHSFAPRNADGSWMMPFDPTRCVPDSWNDPYFYEATSWQWSFSVQHDFVGLIARYGGNEAFVAHLEEFFARKYYYSKEMMLHIPFLSIYAGRPDKAAERVRTCMERYFKVARDGLADNEDMGCQSAWYMCAAIGLYPIMGQDLYLLVPPVFKRTEIVLGKSGKTLIIEAPEACAKQLYIVAATLNDRPLQRAWIRHGEIAQGGRLFFDLAATSSTWGTRELPPSPLSQL